MVCTVTVYVYVSISVCVCVCVCIYVCVQAATGKHGAALLSYLKAGALTSRHFEDEVPAIVWPAQVNTH